MHWRSAGLRLCVAVGTTAATLGQVQALAQVIEIGGDGGVVVHDRPETYDADGARPIPSAIPHRSRPHVRTRGADAGADARFVAAHAVELSPDLVEAVAWVESRLRSGLVSRRGAVGEMQLMPGAARDLGVDARDTVQNYRGGAAYLRRLLQRYDGDLVRTLAAYNAGPAAVDRYAGVPPYPETRAYVAAVMDRLSRRSRDPEAP